MALTEFIKDLVTMTESMLKEDRSADDKSQIRHVRSHLKDAMYIAANLGEKPVLGHPAQATQQNKTCTCPAYPAAVANDCPIHGTIPTN